MAPVGATNVGSIRVYMDEVWPFYISISQPQSIIILLLTSLLNFQNLTTNNKEAKKNLSQSYDKSFCTPNAPDGHHLKRGDNFGEFNLGSTIVLIFEAPENFQFDVKQNEKVFFGQKLGSAIRSAYL